MEVDGGARQNVAPIVDRGRCRSQTRGRLIMSNAESLGRFVWHELLTPDTAAAAAFYPKVVPWRTQPSNMPGYTIWMAGQTQLGGLMTPPAEGRRAAPHWLRDGGTPDGNSTRAPAQELRARAGKDASRDSP